jgi:hypothetical protein
MAEQPKRKTPAKRGPTKAAALKALGLTQEDLDVLLALKDAREDFGNESTLTIAAKQIPPNLKVEAAPEPEIQTPTVTVDSAQSDKEPTWYIRNLRNTEVSFRLTRQQRQGEKRTTLKPRGQRGDIQRLDREDLNDGELQTQIAYGLVEILPEGEALEAIRKQSFNSQQASHPALAMLTNERGEAYEQNAVRVASNEEAFGIKVADLKPVVEGELGEVQVGRGGIQRDLSQQVTAAPGGNRRIISDGFAPVQTNAQLGGVDSNAIAKDALARSKQLEGPVAGLGNVQVTVEPAQKT